MLIVKTRLGLSKIHGIGLFADQNIPKGTMVWEFDSLIDIYIPKSNLKKIPLSSQEQLLRYIFLDKIRKKYLLCGDDARFFNHSDKPNCDDGIDNITIAIRNIKKGVDKNMIEGVEVGLAALAMSPSVSIPSGSVFDYCLVEDCSNYSYIDLCQSTPQHPDEGMTSFSVDSSDLNCVYYSRVFGPKNTVKLAASEIIPYGLEGSSFSVQVRYRRIDTSMWASWRSMSESLGSFGRVGYVFPAPYPVFVQFKIVGTIKGFGMIFYGSLT